MPTPAKAVELAASLAGAASQADDAWRMFQRRQDLARFGKAAKKIPGLGSALAGMEGAAKSIHDTNNGGREAWLQGMGAENVSHPLALTGLDALRTMQNVGNAATFDQAGRLGELLSRFGNR